MTQKVVTLPGQVVNPVLQPVNENLVKLFEDMLARAKAGEIQAAVVAFSGFDCEPILGRALGGEYCTRGGDLLLQMRIAEQQIVSAVASVG